MSKPPIFIIILEELPPLPIEASREALQRSPLILMDNPDPSIMDHDEYEDHACPQCDSSAFPEALHSYAERDGEQVAVGYSLDCPDCGHCYEHGPTEAERRRWEDEQIAGEKAHWEAHYRRLDEMYLQHQDACDKDLPMFSGHELKGYTYTKGCAACRDLMNERGWCVGHPYDYEGPYEGVNPSEPYDADDDNDLPF